MTKLKKITSSSKIIKLKKITPSSKITKLKITGTITLKIRMSSHPNKKSEISKIQSIKEIYSFKINQSNIKKNRIKSKEGKIRHIFFDIDSTLTHEGMDTLDRNVKEVFEKFIYKNCCIYFCTGRSSQNVRGLIKMYMTSPYGIAENGGIIINSKLIGEKFGDRTEPDKLIHYLNSTNIQYNMDPSQQSRRTEQIILKKTLGKTRLNQAIKKSKTRVEVHASKNTYHISKHGINKGTAIEYLAGAEELDLNSNTHEIITVGDSNLDIPMFECADFSYAVGNADARVKKKATNELKNAAPRAIEELFDRIFTYV